MTNSLETVLDDLHEYTKIPKEELLTLVRDRQPWCYKREFTTKRIDSNHFYNLSSQYFIFGNAKHGDYIEDTTKLVEECLNHYSQRPVTFLEFGCGTGNMSLALKEKYGDAVSIYYNELGVLQKDFIEFRFNKRRLQAMRVDDWNFLKHDRVYDVIVALDVLEHIEGYEKYLEKICNSIRQNGFLWEYSPFLENRAADPCHCVEDKSGYRNILKEHGFELQIEPKMSEGYLWKKVK